LKIGKLSHRTSIKDGLGRHIGSCGPLNRSFPKPNGQFAMKNVDHAQRLHIVPISVNPFYSPAGKILIVDDLVSSGTSLKSAYNSLKNKDPNLEVECLTLLGPVT
ncbi:phosphoribosyltransferase family protein, partial [Shewanella indica]|uniref:phosphoribosyltransferase family protein n=3 Tax=Shewanellaceae TaxID=267890 RepID=UPI0039996369